MSDTIENRLTQICDRLTKIEEHLGLVPKTISTPTLQISATVETSLDDWANGAPPAPKVSYQQDNQSESSINWLGYAAVICFVLAAGFIIKLSIDTGWLTPTRQIFIAGLLGFSLIGAGFPLMKIDRKYASLLPAAGIIVLYLTSYASHLFYHLVSFEGALVMAGAVSALCLWLYKILRLEVYAITAAVGTYLSPLILNLQISGEFSFFYFLICSFAFATLSVFMQSRILILVSAYAAIFITAVIGIDMDTNGLTAAALAVHFLIFTVATYFYSRTHGKALSEMEAWSFLPVLVVFYAAEFFFLDRMNSDLAPWISLLFAGVMLVLYLAARKLFPNGLGSQNLILAFITLVSFHAVYLEILPENGRPWLLIAMIVTLIALPTHIFKKSSSGILFIPCIALGIIAAIEYFSIITHTFRDDGTSWIILSFAVVAGLWTLLLVRPETISHARSLRDENRSESYYALLAAAHIPAVLGLYRLLENTGSLAISASWLFYAAAIMTFAVIRKDEIMAKSALPVLAFAAGKALLYDVSSAPSLVRIFCLLLTGAVLYGCGFLLRKIDRWSNGS